MPMQPLSDRVLIRRDEVKEEMSAGGIVMPETRSKEGTGAMAEVVAVGPGRYFPKLDRVVPVTDVKPGDRVVTNRYAGQGVEVDGEELFVVKLMEIHAVLG